VRRVLVAIAICLSIGVACRRAAAPTPSADAEADLAVPVGATPAQRGSLRAVIRATGTVTPAAGSEFLAIAPEPARILDIPKAVGEAVATGDVLVRFDIPSTAADVARQRAEVARIQAQVENSRIAQGRARDLLERGIISRREMEDADREVATAQAELARAEAARTAAEASVGRTILRAPFAGIVAQRFHSPGDVVQGVATDPIVRVVDPARLEVIAAIPAADAPHVLPGAPARLTAPDSPMPLRLTVASRPTAPPGGGDLVVRLLFAEPTTIAVDTRADIEIDGEEHVNAVLVPADAIVREGNDTVAFVAVGDKVERRRVTTGLAGVDSVEIASGVSAGDLVITRGQAGLHDGERISVDVRR
jgi:RND family efflux transporter MFP subunit